MANQSGTTPPGWYPDPTNPNQLRYWDGSTWTDATSDSLVTPFSAPAGTTTATAQGTGELSSISTWFTETIEVVKKKAWPLILLTVLVPIAIWVVALILALAVGWSSITNAIDSADDPSVDPTELLGDLGMFIVVALILMAAAAFVQQVFSLAASDQAYDGRAGGGRSIGQSLGLGLRRLLPFVGWGLLVLVAFVGAMIAAAIVVGLGGALRDSVGVLLAVVVGVGGFVGMIYVGVRLVFMMLVVVLSPGVNPIKGSWALTQGRFWALFGRWMLLVLIGLAIYIVGAIINQVASGIGDLLTLPLNLLFGLFGASAVPVLYFQLNGPVDADR